MLLVDVDINGFKAFLSKSGDATFFWTETTTAIILMKPRGGMAIRTVFMKTTPEAVESWKLNNLFKYNAIFCLNFVIDGKEMVGIRSQQETEGNVEEKEEEEEEVSENNDGVE